MLYMYDRSTRTRNKCFTFFYYFNFLYLFIYFFLLISLPFHCTFLFCFFSNDSLKQQLETIVTSSLCFERCNQIVQVTTNLFNIDLNDPLKMIFWYWDDFFFLFFFFFLIFINTSIYDNNTIIIRIFENLLKTIANMGERNLFQKIS